MRLLRFLEHNTKVEDELIWQDFVKHVEEFNEKSRYSKILLSGDSFEGAVDKEDAIKLWKMLPIKLPNTDEINKSNILPIIKEALLLNNITDGIWGLIDWFKSLQSLYDKGGKIYRLVFLTDIDELDHNNLGNHWTYSLDSTRDFYIDYMYQWSRDEIKGKEPYYLTAYIEPKSNISLGPWDRPEEKEIYVDNDVDIKLLKIDKVTDTSTFKLSTVKEFN